MKTYIVKLKINEEIPYKEEDGIESEKEAIDCFRDWLGNVLTDDNFEVKVIDK